jgi:hypothetical protein
MFKKFLDARLCVIPLKDGLPQVEWSKYFEKLPDSVDGWEKWNEYALVCGNPSNIIALDIDIDDTARIYTLAGETPVRKRGSKGFTAFYRYNGEKSQNWKSTSGEVICEILSDKRLTTIPPSPHRKTKKPYEWIGEGLIGADLPFISDDFIQLMDTKFPKRKPFSVEPPKAFNDHADIALADIENILSYISPDCARDEWVQIGMALRDEFGDAACHIWHNWSGKSSKYNHNAAQSAWRSFTHDGVTIGTLIYYAKRGGWVKEYERPARIKKEKKQEKREVVIGGIVGDIANWITSTALRPQPKLSLAAALSFMGALKGHRVQSSMREARTNLLVLSLAPTGGGKDHPQAAIQKLIKYCGLDSMIMGRPTSGTAMLTGLHKCGSIAWLKVDEMGRYLANATGKQAQSHQREIVDYMIELYSCANRKFYGRQYANEKENPQIIIDQPHFCCLGSTVEEKLRESCKSGEVIDGFLNRWLVFNSKERPAKDFKTKSFDPPIELVDKITKWLNYFPITKDSYGNVSPRSIEFTKEAWDVFLTYEDKIEKSIDSHPYPLNELYARAGEHVVKVATTLADDLWVGMPEITWAIAIVDESISEVINFASGISDNQHEENVNYVMNVIKKYGINGITKDQITQKTRKISNRDRADIINQLLEAGDVTVVVEGKKNTFFSA